MKLERIENGLAIRVPAKVNLSLDVLGKRADGYHQIDSIMCPVTLFDRLELTSTGSNRIEFSITSATERSASQASYDPAWSIPVDWSNLVVRALEAVRMELGQANGCCVTLHKQIPAAAGLGGGSADAAAAIVAGLSVWGRWDRELAMRIASRLGSDIPFFLGDQTIGVGMARATGRGEEIEMLREQEPLCFVITHPPVGSSTAAVYQSWHQTDANQRNESSSSEQVHAVLSNQDATQSPGERTATMVEQLESVMRNALQPSAARLTDWIARQLTYFQQLGKPNAMISGSGSACFALVDDLDQGNQLAENMIQLGLPRAFAAEAWYAPPIEQQLERLIPDLN